MVVDQCLNVPENFGITMASRKSHLLKVIMFRCIERSRLSIQHKRYSKQSLWFTSVDKMHPGGHP